MLEINEAKEAILVNVKPVGCETVPITAALGRILAQDIYSDVDVPLMDNSAMDGFAVKESDIKTASPDSPVRLRVNETIPAGTLPRHKIKHGQASRIMTGSVIPEGAGAVVMVENTKMSDDDHVLIMAPIKNGKTNIRRAGEDMKEGEKVLKAGRLLRPPDIGVLATTGNAQVKVSKQPVVGILTTGSEIIPPDGKIEPGKVRNSNSYSVYAQCVEIGAKPRLLGIVPDSREAIGSVIKKAATSCDIVLTTGGVSMGEYDEVRNVITDLGRIVFWKVRMKPGKPLVFGIIHGTPIFGLPGNPVSAMVGVEIFVRPAMQRMMGASEEERPRLRGVLEQDLNIRMGVRDQIVRGIASLNSDGYRLTTTGPQGSHIISGMSKANCMIYIPNNGEACCAGKTVEFFFIT